MKRSLVMMTGIQLALLVGCANKNQDTMANSSSDSLYQPSTAYDTNQNYYQQTSSPQGGYYAQPQAAPATSYNAPADPYASSDPGYGQSSTSVTTDRGMAYTASDPGYAAAGPSNGSSPMYGETSYTVQKGDSLYVIARKMYGGDMARWRDIYNANRGQIQDPNQLAVGMVLVIP